MKTILFDIFKWGIGIVILGIVLYAFYTRYYFTYANDIVISRGNKISGNVDAGMTVLPQKEEGRGVSKK